MLSTFEITCPLSEARPTHPNLRCLHFDFHTYTEIFRPKQPKPMLSTFKITCPHSEANPTHPNLRCQHFNFDTNIFESTLSKPILYRFEWTCLYSESKATHPQLQNSRELEGKMFIQINLYWVGSLLSALFSGSWPLSAIHPIYIVWSILRKANARFFFGSYIYIVCPPRV